LTRYLVTLEYRGKGFHGFQRQAGLPTIQGAVESALIAFTGEEIRVQGAGRTDTGTHAVGQAAAFDVPYDLEVDKALMGLNALLTDGVSITDIRHVPDGFDPRRDATWREYRYFVLNRAAPSALLDGFTYHYPRELDLDVMNRACAACVGRHDFSAFRAKAAQDESGMREVLLCKVVEAIPGVLSLAVRADSFLYRMIRIMAGALLEVGSGKMSLEEFEGHLRDGGTRPCADPLPACGLFLWRVMYEPGALEVD
jgi:tRNA pseudouridine38-40 synthase